MNATNEDVERASRLNDLCNEMCNISGNSVRKAASAIYTNMREMVAYDEYLNNGTELGPNKQVFEEQREARRQATLEAIGKLQDSFDFLETSMISYKQTAEYLKKILG